MTPAQEAAAAAAVRAASSAREGLLATLQRLLLRSWRRALAQHGTATRPYNALYDPVLVAALAADLGSLSVRGQQQAAGVAVGFQRQLLTGFGIRVPALRVDVPREVRFVPVEDVYARPMNTFRYEVSEGAAPDVALARAEERLSLLADTDVQLAEREASRQVFDRVPQVVGHRRVIHPELSRTGVCGLCIAASDRVYGTGELRPIHDRCKCVSVPLLLGGDDPGGFLNRKDLENLYEAAGGTGRERLKGVKFQVTNHGELGPLLSDAAEKPRTPRAAAKDRTRSTGTPLGDSSPASRAAAELAALEPTLAALEARAAAGEDVAGPLAFQRSRIAKLRGLA